MPNEILKPKIILFEDHVSAIQSFTAYFGEQYDIEVYKTFQEAMNYLSGIFTPGIVFAFLVDGTLTTRGDGNNLVQEITNRDPNVAIVDFSGADNLTGVTYHYGKGGRYEYLESIFGKIHSKLTPDHKKDEAN